MHDWTDAQAPRIWRCPASQFLGDEPRDAHAVYTDEVLAGIGDHGFSGVWLRGRLYELMHSTVLPMLNDEHAPARLESLRQVIARGRQHGMGVYLFFNEPLALPAAHPLWQQQPELRGALYLEGSAKRPMHSLCISAPLGQAFLRQAIASLLDALPGLAGVVLITASEHHAHCWSHTFRYSLDDGIDHGHASIPDCPRCRDREPAELVLELLGMWRDAVQRHAPECRVLAWNWSWSMWYPDPQSPIVEHLPADVELLVDWERGGELDRGGDRVRIDEYSLSYPGPSRRFLTTREAAREGTPVHARLQIGTTHEIATVPNLPLMDNLHAKLAAMSHYGIAGTMACWNFGCSLTLNTAAIGQFLRNPEAYQQGDLFLDDLARRYLGVDCSERLRAAWSAFSSAFRDHYPFATAFLYWSPVNDAPAHPLSLHYRAQRLGPSWLPHAFGDDALTCLGTMELGDVANQLTRLIGGWNHGLMHFEEAMETAAGVGTSGQQEHRREELSVARMIGLQLTSVANFFRFHQRRIELVGAGSRPCILPPDETLIAIMHAEIGIASRALPLTEADARLGYHQESHTVMYSPALIHAKISAMQQELDQHRSV